MRRLWTIVILLHFLQKVALKDVSTVSPILEKKAQNKVISVHSACSRRALMTLFVLKDPFNGRLYARGYPDDCKSMGNGSREISITVQVSQCGTKVIEEKDGTLKYELHLYVQYDKHVQQSTDNLIQVECIPEEVVVTGRMATGANGHLEKPSKASSTSTTTAVPSSPLTVDCWMDILQGKFPVIHPISQHVDVGDELTMVIKIKHAEGVMAKVTNCVASDGSKESQQELIDSNGCSVDPDIMPQLQERQDLKTGLKVVFASFQAFKFPERENLHLQCRVLICNNTCPLDSCKLTKWGFRRRMAREFYSLTGNVLRQMDVFNSVEVKSPLDEDEHVYGHRTAAAMASSNRTEDLFCLNSTRMVIIIGVLLGVLLISLIVSICMCVRARELRRKLLQRQSFPYGRVHEYS